MRYEYQCETCAKRRVEWRSVPERNRLPVCGTCHMNMSRVYSVPIINAWLTHDLPENKYVLGTSERDRYDAAVRGHREFEAQQERNEQRIKYGAEDVLTADDGKPMEEIARDMGVINA